MTSRIMTHEIKGLLWSLVTAVLWGILPIKLKFVLEVMDPITTTWYRLFSSGILLLLFFSYKHKLPKISIMKDKCTILLLSTAVMGLTLNYVLYVIGLSMLAPGNIQVLMQLSPMLLLVSSVLVFNEPFSKSQWLGILVLFIGMLLFFNQKLIVLFSSFGVETKGVLITISAAVVWVFYGLAQKKLLLVFTPSHLMMMIYILCSTLILPFASPLDIFKMNTIQFLLLAFCCLNTLIAYGAIAEAMSIWESSKVSATLTITPLITYIGVWIANIFAPQLIVSDHLNTLAFFGIFMVISGSMLTLLGINKLAYYLFK